MTISKIVAIVIFCLFVIVGCINTISQNMYKELTNNKNYYPSAKMCGECHVAIYEEWKTSKHAFAYNSNTFVEQTNNHRFEECLPCHAPKSIFSENLKLRHEKQEEGITCAVCHLVDGKFAGPIEHSAIVIPHPIEIRTQMYRSSEMCGKCHEGSYKEWLAVEKENKKNCQECHMKEVERKATQGTDFISNQLVKFEHKAKLRRHKFHLEEIENLQGMIDITIQVIDKDTLLCKIKNNIPHGIPSGSFGFRKAVLKIRFLDEQNNEIHIFSQEFFKGLNTSFVANSNWEQQIKIREQQATSAHVILQRWTQEQSYTIYEGKVEIQ